MSELCNVRSEVRMKKQPHMYGHGSVCMYCGHVMDEERPVVTIDTKPRFSREEKRFARVVLMMIAVAIIVVATLLLSGCVTYIHHFEPGRTSTLCANAAGCKELQP